MLRLKDTLTLLLLFGFAAYATWQKLQVLALASLLCGVAIVYQAPVRRLAEIVLTLVRNTKQAKVGNFEVLTERARTDLSELLNAGAGWRKVIVDQLDSAHVALLIQIYKAGAVSNNRAMHDVVRELRSRALVHHDGPNLVTGTEIRLTVLGEDLAASILTPSDQSPLVPLASSTPGTEGAPGVQSPAGSAEIAV